jgi:hypothetical protein
MLIRLILISLLVSYAVGLLLQCLKLVFSDTVFFKLSLVFLAAFTLLAIGILLVKRIREYRYLKDNHFIG